MNIGDINFIFAVLIYGGGSLIVFYGALYILVGYLYYIYKKNQNEIELEGLLFRSAIYTLTIIFIFAFFIIMYLYVIQSPYVAQGIYYFYNYDWSNPDIFQKLQAAYSSDPTVYTEAKSLLVAIVILYIAYIIAILASVFMMFGIFTASIYKCKNQENSDAVLSIECLLSKGFLSVLFIFVFTVLLYAISEVLYMIVSVSNSASISNVSLGHDSFNYLKILQSYAKSAVNIIQNSKP